MAWIENAQGTWINLDNAQGIQITRDKIPIIRVVMDPVNYADICECKDAPTARKVQRRIVGLARGNMLISQEDVRRMIDGQADSN